MADNVTTVGGQGGSSPPPATVIKTTDDGTAHIQHIAIDETTIKAVSTANSSTSTLTAAATFTGTAEDVSQYSIITLAADSDVSGTVRMELSQNGTNWDRAKVVPLDITIGSGSVHTLEVVTQYYRTVYINGASDQGHFRIQTIYHKFKSGFLTSSPDQKISKIDDVQLSRTVNDPFIDISRGLYADKFAIHKFGANESSPSGTRRDIWWNGSTTAGDIDYPWPTTTETVSLVSSSTADDATPTSSTGAQSVTLEGLDGNWDTVSETIDLNGTATVTTTATFRRLYRVYIAEVGTYTGSNVGNITCTHTSSGGVLAYVPAGFGQTHLSMYTVPAGHTAYLRHAHGSVSAGTNKDATLRFWRRLNSDDITQPFSGGARVVHTWEQLQGAVELDFYSMPSFPEKTDLWWTANGSATTAVSVVYDLIVVEGDSPSAPQ